MGMSVLVYIKRTLGFSSSEWMALSDEDKEWYKKAGEEEMAVLGITA